MNRVAVTIQPVPYLEQVVAEIQRVTGALGVGFRAVAGAVRRLTAGRSA